MAGLAVDFGFVTMERRSLQNAADAAAVSGAIRLSEGTTSGIVSNDVSTVSTRNAFVQATTVTTCQYVDSSNNVLQACTPADATAPAAASGVRVVATNVRETFFMRMLGISNVTISADSIARISDWQRYTPALDPSVTTTRYLGANALFIVCGFDTVLYNPKVGDPPSGTLSIFEGTMPGTAPWRVRKEALNREFIIHTGNPHGISDCEMHSESFKGLNGTTGEITLPAILTDLTGTKAGPTSQAVNGIDGCAKGVDHDSLPAGGCVMILPVAATATSDKPIAPWCPANLIDKKDELCAVRWLPFRVREIKKNLHVGTLLPNYIVRQGDDTVLGSWTNSNTSTITTVRTVR